MEVNPLCKSSKNLTVEDNFSNTQFTYIRNNLSQNENRDDKSILFNFLSSKKRMTLNSCFDHKGAKKFLLEKEKAMASLELPDDIIEDKKKKKRRSRKSIVKSKSKPKLRSESLKEPINFNLGKSKYRNEDKRRQKRKKMSEKTVPLYYDQNNKSQQERKLTINSDFSNIKGKESLNLASNHNDSFIHLILKEMAEVEH